jgi:sigma-B regulation protein RsbU (phosphoserine phosphatase)
MLLRTRIVSIFGIAALALLLTAIVPLSIVEDLTESALNDARHAEQDASFALALARTATPLEILAFQLGADLDLFAAVTSEDAAASTRVLQVINTRAKMSRLDIVTAEGRLFASSAGLMAERPLIDTTNLHSRIQQNAWLDGLETGPDGRMLITVTTALPAGGYLTIATPADAVLPKLGRGGQRKVFLIDRAGRLLLSTDPDDWPALAAALARAQGQVDPGAETALLVKAGHIFNAIATPLRNTASLEIGTLVLMQDVTAAAQRRSLVLLGAGSAALIAFAALLLALYGFINGALYPLAELTRVIRAMAAGDSLVSADLPDRADEVGAIAQAVEVFRRDIVALARTKISETLRQAQQRMLIRDEMEKLAGMLEADERAGLKAELGGIEATAEGEKNTALATGFKSMAARVTAQHRRLADLLAERTRDLESVRQALAERAHLSRLRQELEVARHLQLSSLPQVFPPFPDRTDFEVYAAMEPAKEVGGDFYDFALLGGDRLAVMIGDASGKGVPAALFIAMARSMLRSAVVRGASPAQALGLANSTLAVENHTMMFVTAFVAILDLQTGWLTYANGGHNPPYIIGADLGVQALGGSSGISLGVMEDAEYEDSELLVPEGASLVLFTDGVTEAGAVDESMFGEERLERALTALALAGPEVTVAAIQEAVRRFADGVEQADDITVLSARYLGPAVTRSRAAAGQRLAAGRVI